MRSFGPILVLACAALAACVRGSSKETDPAASSSATPLAASASPPPSSAIAERGGVTVIDFTANNASCTMGHRGFLLDLADTTMRARMSGSKLVPAEVETREHEGASWASVNARALDMTFVAPAETKPEAGIVVEARVRGGLARSAAVFLNGKPLGTLTFAKGETKIISTRGPATILRGPNELTLRFNGGTRTTHDQLAEIDWIRVGANDGEAPYAAPTRGDVITTVGIAGTSRRGVSLRAPGFARCTAFVPNGAVLEGSIGVTGGEAEAEVRVLVDRSEPRVIGSFHLGGPTDPQGWRPVALPLGDVGTVAGVELVAKSSTKGARIVFGEARVVAPGARVAKVAPPKARGVILVVLGSVSRRQLSPWGGPIAATELAQLANGGTIFEAHRASSPFASGAVASMLTGATPREHGASDSDAALLPDIMTVAQATRQAGVVTAMFTANPTTTTAYGFARGWSTFETRLPSEDTPAVAIFDDVGRWLDEHKNDRFFVVVHARGGHPPWDVTSEELKELPPANYTGSLEPKHAGEALAKARRAGMGRLFSDVDRERAFALHAKAVSAHDAALGRLVAHVRALGRDKDTVWIVSGDVGVDAAAHVPFLEEDSVDEGALALPLVVRSPEPPARARASGATSSVDVARTVLETFALPPPAELGGESLWTIGARGAESPERPLFAGTTTRFSMRWGGFALVGARDKESKLCNLALDPDCVSDVRATHPLAAEALHALAFDELVGKKAADAAVRANLPRSAASQADATTTTALKAWGR
jgi:arylsulfatase A-like enzyme